MAKQETKAATLANYIESVRKSLPEMRNFYLDEKAQEKNRKEEGHDAWNVQDPEQYLKRLYNATTAFALRNGLYGRAEFFSDEVKEVMSKDHRFAKLWIPQNFNPIIDALRHKVTAKVFGPLRRPDQEEYSKATFEAMVLDPEIRDLIAFPIDDDDDDDPGVHALHAAWGEKNFKSVENIGYATVTRLAVFTQIKALIESGWIWPFMGIGDIELEGDFPVLAALHVLNGRATTDGAKGRAFIHALLGFFGTKGGGLFVGKGIPDGFWEEADLDRWCEGAGFMSGGLAGYWGMELPMPPRPEDAAPRPAAELSPEAAAMMKMLADALAQRDQAAEKPEQAEQAHKPVEKPAKPEKEENAGPAKAAKTVVAESAPVAKEAEPKAGASEKANPKPVPVKATHAKEAASAAAKPATAKKAPSKPVAKSEFAAEPKTKAPAPSKPVAAKTQPIHTVRTSDSNSLPSVNAANAEAKKWGSFVDTKAVDANGWNAMMHAAHAGDLEAVGKMLSYTSMGQVNNDGKAAIDLARDAGHAEIVDRFERVAAGPAYFLAGAMASGESFDEFFARRKAEQLAAGKTSIARKAKTGGK
jgi:hypothetical protein